MMITIKKIVRPCDLPPDDKPYLISSKKELAEDVNDDKEFQKEWFEKCPFPGIQVDKLEWLKDFLKLDNDIAFSMYGGPNAEQVAKETLLKQAPSQIRLELYATVSDLTKVKDCSGVDASLFAKNLGKYGNPEYPSSTDDNKTWSSYCQWLLTLQEEKANNNEENKETSKNNVLLAHTMCAPTGDLVDKMSEMLSSLGLKLLYTYAQANNPEEDKLYSWGLQELVGENLYFASNKNSNDNIPCVQLQVNLKNPSAIKKANVAWKDTLDTLQEDLNKNLQAEGRSMMYVAISKPPVKKGRKKQQQQPVDDEDDDLFVYETKVTAETHYVLWLPSMYQKEIGRIRGHFDGKEESFLVQHRLKKCNTDAGNAHFEIMKQEFKYIKNYPTLQERWIGALALVCAATESTFWMSDNEYASELVDLWKEISAYFRNIVLKHSDKELGIGHPTETEDEEGFSESRKALYRWLGFRAKMLNDVPNLGYGKVRFNWRPPKSRKRKEAPAGVTMQRNHEPSTSSALLDLTNF